MGVSLFTLTAIFRAAYQLVAEIVATASNPVTYALNATGSGTRYDVTNDAGLDAVPWGALTAGSVVNIFYSATPYTRKFGLRAQGTSTNPVRIHGVTNASGVRPIFDVSSGSITCPSCNPSGGYGGANDIFSNVINYGEELGAINIKPGTNDPYGAYKPCWIEIKNIQLQGVNDGTAFTPLPGAVVVDGSSNVIPGAIPQFRTFCAGIWIQLGTDITIENCILTNNVMGFFSMENLDTLNFVCERITLRSNRIFANGRVGAEGVHNCYLQCLAPVVEGNYFGPLRVGALGSTFKDRSAKLVFRSNWIECSARSLDMVHAENQVSGLSVHPDYGTDYVYNNVFVNDFDLPGGGGINPIHYGGDNLGEDGDTGALITPSVPYRSQLYFWNNTVINKSNYPGNAYRCSIIQLSLVGTKADLWNNVIIASGTTNFMWTANAGTMNIRGKNHVVGTIADVTDSQLDTSRYAINKLGTIVTTDPLIVDLANGDYRIGVGSPAIDQSGALPSGVPSSIATDFPILYQPMVKSNGLVPRTVQGSAFDLGALEYGVGTGLPIVAPSNTGATPYITGTAEVGSVQTANVGGWTGSNPISYAIQWKNGGVNISGATATTYTPVATGTLTFAVTASNVSGVPVTVSSAGVTIAPALALPAAIGNSTSNQATSSDNAPTIAIPTGAVSGDEYWLAVRYGSASNTLTVTGFTEDTNAHVTEASLGGQLRVFKKTTAGGESGNFTGALSGYSDWSAICVVVKGMSATPDASSASGSYQYTDVKPLTGAAITTTGSNRTILWFGGNANSGDGSGAVTLTPPTGLLHVKTSNSGIGNALSLCAGEQASAGAATYSGTATFATAVSRTALVSTIALVAG